MTRFMIAIPAALMFFAFVGRAGADELDDAMTAVHKRLAPGPAAALKAAQSDLAAARASKTLTVEEPWPWYTFASTRDLMVTLDRGRTLSITRTGPYADQRQDSSFRVGKGGTIIRRDSSYTVGGLLNPTITNLKVQYKNAAGKSMFKPLGWLRYKLARGPIAR